MPLLFPPGYVIDRVIDSHLSAGRATATHAYLVSRSGAARLLDSYDPTTKAVDIFFFQEPSLRRLLLTPSVAYQADRADTDITDRITALDRDLGKEWLQCVHSRGVSHSSFLNFRKEIAEEQQWSKEQIRQERLIEHNE